MDSQERVCSVLDSIKSPAELRTMLTQRDSAGSTPFMCAMKRADSGASLALLQRAQAARSAEDDASSGGHEDASGSVLSQSLRCDIACNPPLHCLAGLGGAPHRAVRRLASDVVDAASLHELLKEPEIVSALDSDGYTALEALVHATSGLGRSETWKCINPSGVNIRSDPSFRKPPVGRISHGEVVDVRAQVSRLHRSTTVIPTNATLPSLPCDQCPAEAV